MSLGLDTLIIIVLVVGAVGALIFLQRAGSKKGAEPPEKPGK